MKNKIGYKSVIDLGRDEKVYFPHNIGDYPTKILPQIIGEFIERFSYENELIVDPFCGSGTTAVECVFRNRRSINIDINPRAIEISKQKLSALEMSLFPYKNIKEQIFILADSRNVPLKSEIADLVITDIPYADMIRYSELPNDLSNIDNYDEFLNEIHKALLEIMRILKPERYAIIFCADYRIARSRIILPLHSDIINLMLSIGFVLFDLYIWRYYRSGDFRPFGNRPFQAMNLHSYILVFHKRKNVEIKKNRGIRYRKKLLEKIKT